MTFEEEMKYRVDNGFMASNGAPLKCECGVTDFKQINQYYGECYIEEYQLECNECHKIVGHWAYGNWQV